MLVACLSLTGPSLSARLACDLHSLSRRGCRAPSNAGVFAASVAKARAPIDARAAEVEEKGRGKDRLELLLYAPRERQATLTIGRGKEVILGRLSMKWKVEKPVKMHVLE